jgi:dolichol kinase
MAKRNYNEYRALVEERWVDDFKSEFGRKVLHLFTTFVILFFWSLGTILENLGILTTFNLDNYSFSHWLIITIGFGFVIMFQVADLARLNKFYMLPNWAKRWFLSMRPEELNTFIASTPLVLSLVPFIFAPFPILASVALITTGADAVACIIGKKYGTHKLKKDSNKTIEGFIAGGVSSFLIVLIVLNLYHAWMPISFVKILLMAIVSTVLFLLVDFFANYVSDNILNPILTGFGMWLILLL